MADQSVANQRLNGETLKQVMWVFPAWSSRACLLMVNEKITLPTWIGGVYHTAWYSINLTGTLSGTLSISGGASVVLNSKITVIHKDTKIVVAQTRPLADGTFTLTGLDKTNVNSYFVICEVPGSYNAIIYDKIVVS